MLITVIPAPTVITESGPGFRLGSGMAVGPDPALAGVAGPFLTALADDHDLRLALINSPT